MSRGYTDLLEQVRQLAFDSLARGDALFRLPDGVDQP